MCIHDFQIEVWREFNNTEDIEFYVYFNEVKYYGWAFTLKGISSVMKKDSITGECAAGKYFWAENFLIVDEITGDCLRAVVSDLIHTDPDILGSIFSVV